MATRRRTILTIGSWLQLFDPAIAEMMARGPFDWLTVDREHTTTSDAQMGELIRIVSLAGKPCFVRVADHDPAEMKRALDAGAAGIIVPSINTPEQARAVAAAATYPPTGSRGVGLARAQGYGVGFEAYREWIGRELQVIAQIEHVEGVANLEAILEVDGITGFFIGPYDLSASLGHPGDFAHPEYRRAMDRITTVIGTSAKPAGFHVVAPDLAQLGAAITDGYRFIAFASDMLIMSHYLRDLTEGIRELRERT